MTTSPRTKSISIVRLRVCGLAKGAVDTRETYGATPGSSPGEAHLQDLFARGRVGLLDVARLLDIAKHEVQVLVKRLWGREWGEVGACHRGGALCASLAPRLT